MTRFTRREFFEDSLFAAAGAAWVPSVSLRLDDDPGPRSPNETIRLAVLGVRGRGRAHVGAFKKSKDSEVVAICDPDEGVTALAKKACPKATYYKDLRKMLEDDSIDAVSVATPNHWHSLATIWAIEAGKHVYVEKPISHNLQEGRRVVEAARKHGKIVQHGTQSRSTEATSQAMEWLRAGGLGKVHVARALCYKPRGSIGKVKGPQKTPSTLDYDLWTGPAALKPLMRKNLHYDWHWVFETGNGDMGNQGVHQMDIARWGLGKDGFPDSVVSCGGRLGYEDDGNTPNTQISVFHYGDQQLVFEVRGLKTSAYSPPSGKGAKIGVIFHCEEGYMVSASYGKVLAFDLDGNVVKTFSGGGDHFQNFLDAVKSGKREDLNAESIEGHLSSGLCHLGNISYQMGQAQKLAKTDTPFGNAEVANESFRRFRDHLVDNGVKAAKADYAMGPTLSFNPKRERFTGDHADAANELTTRRYRAPFVVPSQI